MPDWQEILSRDGPAAWRTAYRLLGHRADADECFQEACLAALEVSRRGPVRHWRALLQRLAAARAVDRLRARRRSPRAAATELESVSGHDPSPAQSAADAELSERLREALSQIPLPQAEVFCLHCLDGWSYQDIAEQLALTVNAVGVLLYRARHRLRELLAGALEAPTSRPREESA